MKTIVIDKTIKNIKKNTLILQREYLQQKYQKKNTLQGFGGNTYSKSTKYKNFLFIYLFLSFLYIKRRNIKMSLISAIGYENAGIGHLIIKKLANFG